MKRDRRFTLWTLSALSVVTSGFLYNSENTQPDLETSIEQLIREGRWLLEDEQEQPQNDSSELDINSTPFSTVQEEKPSQEGIEEHKGIYDHVRILSAYDPTAISQSEEEKSSLEEIEEHQEIKDNVRILSAYDPYAISQSEEEERQPSIPQTSFETPPAETRPSDNTETPTPSEQLQRITPQTPLEIPSPAPTSVPTLPETDAIPAPAPAPTPLAPDVPIVNIPEAIAPPPSAPTTLPAAAAEEPFQEEVFVTPDPLVDSRAVKNAESERMVKRILINFNNVNIVEFIRFISRVSNKNFVFDENDLQFNVTIVSEEPTSIDNIMAALLQELRIHGLTMFEQGNNVIIHKNPTVNAISRVVGTDGTEKDTRQSEIITQLFRLNTTDPDKVAPILKPLVSDAAIIEVFRDTHQIIVTDLAANVRQIAELIKHIDSPVNGLVIGQYVVRRGLIDSLVQLAQQIMHPIAQDQPLMFVPHKVANSIFIVTTPFLMERTIAILQYLDQQQGLTRIFNLQDLRFTPEGGIEGIPPERIITPTAQQGEWQLDSNGNWVYRPFQEPGVPSGAAPPEGYWEVDESGNWRFKAGERPGPPQGPSGLLGPEGQWRLDSQGVWVFQLAPGRSISPERLVRHQRGTADLPPGDLERTQFYIHKLLYRTGNQVEAALGRIGVSLRQTGDSNSDLVQTIESVQWIEASNSLIFTGTQESLDKARQLVLEIDAPLRQVFIEMLILETTLDETLNYSVNWGTRFGGGNTSGSQAFLSPNSPLPRALNTTGVNRTPNANSLALTDGFSLGVVGQRITHNGTQYASLGALVQAIHRRTDTRVVMSPKLLTEDNYAAEVFSGLNIPFPAQSIANDQGNIVTQNFEYRDVGIRLKVTPQIGENGMITLTVVEEVSSIVGATANRSIQQGGPTTRKSNTTTKVHMPNEFFLVISGVTQTQTERTRDQVPCLGGIPFIGAGFSDKRNADTRDNLMIFIRPRIIDTQEEMDNVTMHEQDIMTFGRRVRANWRYEVNEALDLFNLPFTDCPKNAAGFIGEEE